MDDQHDSDAVCGRIAGQSPTGCHIYIVPMVNPDGIEISTGIEAPICDCQNTDNWQANACGVDLNHNYDAGWEESKAAEAEHGITGPGPTRFSGTCAESEPESRAVADFTRRIKPDIAAALHSQGEVIYYDFCGHVPSGGLELGERMAQASGYALEQPEGIASYGGYKDWFIDKFDRPGYTIEIGLGTNPLPAEDFDKVYASVLPLLHILIEGTASSMDNIDVAPDA